MYTDDISHIGNYWEVFLTLRIDDNCGIYWGMLTLVMQGMVNYLNCANILSLLCFIRESSINDHTEKVEVIHLLQVVNISFT